MLVTVLVSSLPASAASSGWLSTTPDDYLRQENTPHLGAKMSDGRTYPIYKLSSKVDRVISWPIKPNASSRTDYLKGNVVTFIFVLDKSAVARYGVTPKNFTGLDYSFIYRYNQSPGDEIWWRNCTALEFEYNSYDGNANLVFVNNFYYLFSNYTARGYMNAPVTSSEVMTKVPAQSYSYQTSQPDIWIHPDGKLLPDLSRMFIQTECNFLWNWAQKDSLVWYGVDIGLDFKYVNQSSFAPPTFPDFARINLYIDRENPYLNEGSLLAPDNKMGVDFPYLYYVYCGSNSGRPLTSKDTNEKAKQELNELLSGENQGRVDLTSLENALSMLNLGQYSVRDILKEYNKPLNAFKALFNGLFAIQEIRDLLYFSVVLGGFTMFVSGIGLAVKAGRNRSKKAKKESKGN